MPEHNIRILFRGHFQSRFATDPDPSHHPRGQNGWTLALPGEPDFDRVSRLNDPVALRSGAPSVVTRVTTVLRDGTKVADALVGKKVNLGPRTLFFGDQNHPVGRELLRDFELHVGDTVDYIAGTCSTMPQLQGVQRLDQATQQRLGLTPDVVWNAQVTARIAQIAATGGIHAGDRIAHLKRFTGFFQGMRCNFSPAPGTLDSGLALTPQDSALVKELLAAGVSELGFEVTFFNFDGDWMVGGVRGQITATFVA